MSCKRRNQTSHNSLNIFLFIFIQDLLMLVNKRKFATWTIKDPVEIKTLSFANVNECSRNQWICLFAVFHFENFGFHIPVKQNKHR